MKPLTDFEVHLWFGRNEADPYRVKWRVLDTPVTPFWLKYLIVCLRRDYFFKPRFMGFIDGKRNPQYLANQLNECIEMINRDGRHHIPERLEGEFTQEFSNAIHHHFEILIGSLWEQTEYWKNSHYTIKSAVCGLNDYVHELEAWQRSTLLRQGDAAETMAYILTEFHAPPGMDIREQFEDQFTLETGFGDMLLHYCQIGKTWMEVCIDQDEDIFDPAIQPLWRLTGAFNVNFFDVDAKALKTVIHDHLRKLGKNPEDPSLRLGQIRLAEIDMEGQSRREIVRKIGNKDDICRIEVVKNGDRIAAREFLPKIERYYMKR